MQKRLKELGDSTSEKMKEEVAQYKIDLEKEKKERERLLAAQQAEVLALQGTVTNLGQSLTDSLTPRVEKLEKEKASVVAGATPAPAAPEATPTEPDNKEVDPVGGGEIGAGGGGEGGGESSADVAGGG